MSSLRPLTNNNNNNGRNMPFIIGAVALSALLVVGLIALVAYLFFFQGGAAKNQIAQASPTALPTSTPGLGATDTPLPAATATEAGIALVPAAQPTDTAVPTDTPVPTSAPGVVPTGSVTGEGEESGGGPQAVSTATATVSAATGTPQVGLQVEQTPAAGQQGGQIPQTGFGGLGAIAAGFGLALVLLVARKLRTA